MDIRKQGIKSITRGPEGMSQGHGPRSQTSQRKLSGKAQDPQGFDELT